MLCLGNLHNVDAEEQAPQTIQQSQTNKQQSTGQGDEGPRLNIEGQHSKLCEGGVGRQWEKLTGM